MAISISHRLDPWLFSKCPSPRHPQIKASDRFIVGDDDDDEDDSTETIRAFPSPLHPMPTALKLRINPGHITDPFISRLLPRLQQQQQLHRRVFQRGGLLPSSKYRSTCHQNKQLGVQLYFYDQGFSTLFLTSHTLCLCLPGQVLWRHQAKHLF